MHKNACIDCRHYEKCGRPERPIKCMGYEEAAVDKQNCERNDTDRTQKMYI